MPEQNLPRGSENSDILFSEMEFVAERHTAWFPRLGQQAPGSRSATVISKIKIISSLVPSQRHNELLHRSQLSLKKNPIDWLKMIAITVDSADALRNLMFLEERQSFLG